MDFTRIKNVTRRESVKRLYWYLKNPGNFSVLILGKPGVGKSHWVKEIQKELSKNTICATRVVEVSLKTVSPNKEVWENIFKEADNGILLIKELEHIKPHDNLLFEALATTNGKYGFDEKKFSIRIAFTTSYSIDSLRKTEEFISNRLFDRIAQLVVAFPSFDDANIGIWEDFKATWEKMNFQEWNKLPRQKLKEWLDKSSHTLKGNFRDLDKIAILWHQFRLMKIQEKDILKEVTHQLQQYSAYPEQHTDLGDAFFFQKDNTKEQIEDEFKAAFKKWTIKTYGSLRKAAKPLDMSPRTMERW